MTTAVETRRFTSREARQKFIDVESKPFMITNWLHVVFMHYRVPPAALQPLIPFELDLREDDAFVSLVAFEFTGTRMVIGGRELSWITAPVDNHGFLNVRTYVKHEGEPGIFFMREWLPNRLSILIGPRTFGLPYHYGRLEYNHTPDSDLVRGEVRVPHMSDTIAWEAKPPSAFSWKSCDPDTLDEFLMECYTAFTAQRSTHRLFRVWHEPWPLVSIDLRMTDESLLTQTGDWIDHSEFVGANYSPGVRDVWMGRPHCINGKFCHAR